MRRAAWALVVAHGLALVFALFGILIAVPHPELWSGSPGASAFFAFAMTRTGWIGMTLGALAMLAYGFWALGARRTLLFFLAATVISAAAELTGTKTGWPFGGYAYTDFLGAKLLGRVPFAIPLSWFTMGFASLVLAQAVAGRTARAIVFAAWLLTAWDLVLDPSMAAPQLQALHFWVWHEHGPYFGMPLRNLAGWFATGLLFIAAGRLAWRERTPPRAPVTLPFTVYALNVVWSMILSVSAGMWPTALVAVALSLAPAALAFAPRRGAGEPWGMLGPRVIARWALRTQTRAVRVEGAEHVPAAGPVLIVARHYHHLLDGAVLVRHLHRPVHIVVALDWAGDALQRRWMERACRLAHWPVILRPRSTGARGAYAPVEVARYLRAGLRDAAALLRAGRVVVVFPEGYPFVDPSGAAPQPRDADGFLPFAGGYRTIARLAGRDVAVVPLGFHYTPGDGGWQIAARFGEPCGREPEPHAVEAAVRALSR